MTGLEMAGSLKVAQAAAQPAGRGFQAAWSGMELEVDCRWQLCPIFLRTRAATYLFVEGLEKPCFPIGMSKTLTKILSPCIFVLEVSGRVSTPRHECPRDSCNLYARVDVKKELQNLAAQRTKAAWREVDLSFPIGHM